MFRNTTRCSRACIPEFVGFVGLSGVFLFNTNGAYD